MDASSTFVPNNSKSYSLDKILPNSDTKKKNTQIYSNFTR